MGAHFCHKLVSEELQEYEVPLGVVEFPIERMQERLLGISGCLTAMQVNA